MDAVDGANCMGGAIAAPYCGSGYTGAANAVPIPESHVLQPLAARNVTGGGAQVVAIGTVSVMC